MQFYLAPLEGVTGYIVRNAFVHHFPYIDKYFTPFFPAAKRMNKKIIRDLIPENNPGIKLVPQLMVNDAKDMEMIGKQLKDMGFESVNLNCGCPSGTVVAKKRGSGFLEYPMELDEFLYQVYDGLAKVGMELSVKTRVGKEKPEEFEGLLSIYNRYPLKNLIVHPRVQADYYKNHPHMEAFELAVRESRNPVLYNGDLFRRAEIEAFGQKYPGISAVMLGRGLLTNPALAETKASCIAEEKAGSVPRLTVERIRAFHADVLEGYRKAIPGDKNVLFKMKELWTYLGEAFEDSAKPMKKIRKAQRMEEYQAEVESLLMEKQIHSEPVFPGWNK